MARLARTLGGRRSARLPKVEALKATGDGAAACRVYNSSMPSRSVHAVQSIRADGPRSMPIPASGPRSPSRSAELGSRKGLPKLDALNVHVPQTGGFSCVGGGPMRSARCTRVALTTGPLAQEVQAPMQSARYTVAPAGRDR